MAVSIPGQTHFGDNRPTFRAASRTWSHREEDLRFLIVEDHPEMRRVIRRLISGIATEIVECDDGGEALEAYANSRPDWVLMDIEMKVMDGITATEQIRAVFPEAKVIIVTNHDNQALRHAAREAGARGYILKDNLFEMRSLLQGSTE